MNRFFRAARTYDQHAEAQAHFARLLMQELPVLPDPCRMLDIGCGTGLLTALLTEKYFRGDITAVDLAPAMIEIARGKDLPRVQWQVADAMQYESEHPFHLIAANASFQWLQPLDDVIARFAGLLREGGYLAFSVMTAGTLAELQDIRHALHPDNAPRSRLRPFNLYRSALNAHGLTILHARPQTFCVWHASASALLRALNEQGVNGGEVSRGKTHALTRGELQELRHVYAERHQRADGAVPATYEAGIFVARKSS